MSPEKKYIVGFNEKQLERAYEIAFRVVDGFYKSDLQTMPNTFQIFNSKIWYKEDETSFHNWKNKISKIEKLSPEESSSLFVITRGEVIPIRQYQGETPNILRTKTIITGMPGTGKTTLGIKSQEEFKKHDINLRYVPESTSLVGKERFPTQELMYKGHSLGKMMADTYHLIAQDFFLTANNGPCLLDRGVTNQVAFAYANKVLGFSQRPNAEDLFKFVAQSSAIMSANIDSLIIFNCEGDVSIKRRGLGRLLTPEYYEALSEGFANLPFILAEYRNSLTLTKDRPLLLYVVDANKKLDEYSDKLDKFLGTTFNFYAN